MKIKNVMVIGGEGYIGSALSQYLQPNYNIINVDLCWFGRHTQNNIHNIDMSKLIPTLLHDIDTIVLLAGHSSTKMCIGDWPSTFNNNVYNFVSLLRKIKYNKTRAKIIFASSSSVYGNTFGEIVDEEYEQKTALNEYDASKIMLEQAATQEKEIEWYGLRFGTVNGFSPNFRSELMINSMYTSAIKNSAISVTNPNIHRSILGITDLCRAIESILTRGSRDNTGFYNISSFNSTVDEISKTVSDMTNCKIIYKEDVQSPYDFKTTNAKFENTFDFKFKETLSSIVENIQNNFNDINNFSPRDANISYWS